jgi:hypothetical protein
MQQRHFRELGPNDTISHGDYFIYTHGWRKSDYRIPVTDDLTGLRPGAFPDLKFYRQTGDPDNAVIE